MHCFWVDFAAQNIKFSVPQAQISLSVSQCIPASNLYICLLGDSIVICYKLISQHNKKIASIEWMGIYMVKRHGCWLPDSYHRYSWMQSGVRLTVSLLFYWVDFHFCRHLSEFLWLSFAFTQTLTKFMRNICNDVQAVNMYAFTHSFILCLCTF